MPLLAVILILSDTTMYQTFEKDKESWIRRIVTIDDQGCLTLIYDSPENRTVAVLDSNFVPIKIKKWHLDTLIYQLTVNGSLAVTRRGEEKVLPLEYPFYDRHTLDYVLGLIRKEKILIYLPERDYEKARLIYDEEGGKVTLKPTNFFFQMFGIKFEFWFDDSGRMIRYKDSFGRELRITSSKPLPPEEE
ncbi:MAG TPA: hypothetical protein EYP58_06180 [bacterium (Candidatus Stahlbacteria)]|nr:hypothetical protein [Candidatus Stahlbacteria bacterium]